MIPIVTGAITGAALMGSVIIGGAIASRRDKNNVRLPKSPSYVERYMEFQKANIEYERLLVEFEQTLSKEQRSKLLELKVKANDAQIKWQRCEAPTTEELLELNEPPIKASKNSCVDCGISVEPYEAQCSDCRRQV